MNIKKIIILLISIVLLSGCSIVYELEITDNGYNENFKIISGKNEKILDYEIPAFSNSLGFEDLDVDFSKKIKGIKYYEKSIENKDDTTIINYKYQFNENNIKESNFLNSSFETIIINKYDHDGDNKDDYMLLSTDDNFLFFDKTTELESVQINIKCNYEVISNNADKINENIYTWIFKSNDKKSINMVYNPDKFIDSRNLLEKILDGDYLNVFIISIIIFVLGCLLYKYLQNKSKNVNKT